MKKSSLEKEEILDKEECSTREKEDMDFDLLDGADVLEEAFVVEGTLEAHLIPTLKIRLD